jgi:hypothetical protein
MVIGIPETEPPEAEPLLSRASATEKIEPSAKKTRKTSAMATIGPEIKKPFFSVGPSRGTWTGTCITLIMLSPKNA